MELSEKQITGVALGESSSPAALTSVRATFYFLCWTMSDYAPTVPDLIRKEFLLSSGWVIGSASPFLASAILLRHFAQQRNLVYTKPFLSYFIPFFFRFLSFSLS